MLSSILKFSFSYGGGPSPAAKSQLGQVGELLQRGQGRGEAGAATGVLFIDGQAGSAQV